MLHNISAKRQCSRTRCRCSKRQCFCPPVLYAPAVKLEAIYATRNLESIISILRQAARFQGRPVWHLVGAAYTPMWHDDIPTPFIGVV